MACTMHIPLCNWSRYEVTGERLPVTGQKVNHNENQSLLRFHPRSNRVIISGPTRANAGTFAEELVASEIKVGGCGA
jgi:hypothetical protein